MRAPIILLAKPLYYISYVQGYWVKMSPPFNFLFFEDGELFFYYIVGNHLNFFINNRNILEGVLQKYTESNLYFFKLIPLHIITFLDFA